MGKSIRRIAALARIIVIDGIRRHALIGLLGLSLAAEAGGLLFFDFIPRDIGRATSDFLFSVSWLAGFVFIFFHAVQAMAWDDERQVIHSLLARPLSRAEYVLGTFTGLGALLLMLNICLGFIGWGTLMFVQNSVDTYYFSYFSHGYYLLTWMGLYAMQIAILGAVMLFSGLIRGSFPVLLVSLCYYLICSGLPVVREVTEQHLKVEGSKISAKLLQALTAIFPDFGKIDFKNAVVADMQLPWTQAAANLSLVLIYAAILLWLSCLIYQKRDLL
jgi:Cu-processing system permease protein